METIEKVNYRQLFNLHCSNEKYRPALQQPFKRDGYYFATDGISLLWLPQSEMELDFFVEREDTPNCLSVIPKGRTEPVEIDCNKLLSVIDKKVPKVKEQEVCNFCDGEGSLECNLGHDHECEQCDGKGTYDKRNAKLITDESVVLVFDGVAMKVRMLQKLIQTASILRRDKVLWIYRENQKAAWFQLYPFNLLMMSCANPPVDDDDKYINVALSEITS